METLKITDNILGQMCRLCLSRGMTLDDIFCFSSELGKKIVDIIMECAPVHITRHDEMPTYICQLCFTQLKKFHQFQMQIVRSDKKLQHYLQQVKDPQINVELFHEEQVNNSESQSYNADATKKCDPFEINDEFDNSSLKPKMVAKFSSVNKVNDEIPIKLEIKDEPMDDDSLVPTECADTAETLSTYDSGEISCENSMIKHGDRKIEYVECSIKIENDMMDNIPLKSEETSISDSSLCSEKVTDFDCLRSNEDNMNRAEHPIRQNLNENSKDINFLLKSTTSTRGKSHQCDICQKCFRTARNLRSHKSIHTGEKPYQCDICQKCFRQLSNLKRHNLIHTGEKPHRCEICQMCFRQASHLQKHNSMHTGEKPYQCDICQMCFSHGSHLKRHKFIHTDEKPYQCNICQMRFSQMALLKIHNLKHSEEKPYQCNICQMYFSHESHLKRHELIHTGEKTHQCNICQMCFTRGSRLKRHKLIHTGEKPYQCDICQMRFNQLAILKIHNLKHTEEKPYQCDICDMRFRHQSSLKNHKLIHTGEKPHQCDVCQMRFRQPVQLKIHSLKHTGEKPHQ